MVIIGIAEKSFVDFRGDKSQRPGQQVAWATYSVVLAGGTASGLTRTFMGGTLKAMDVQPQAQLDLGSFYVKAVNDMSYTVVSYSNLTLSKVSETGRANLNDPISGKLNLIVSGSSTLSTDKLTIKFYWE